MMRHKFLQLIAILACLTLAPTADGQRVVRERAGTGGRWQYLGEANVDGRSDHDKIDVGASKGVFRRIQIAVQNAPVDFDRVVVHYEDGSQFPVALTSVVPAGGVTREMDLPGAARQIRNVEIWYRKGPWTNQKPKIRLMGIH